jgi:hypothetical protein
MKTLNSVAVLLCALIASCAPSTDPQIPEAEVIEDDFIRADLSLIPAADGWTGNIETAKLVDKDGEAAIEFDQMGVNMVWLDGFEFTEGTIEFDAKGKSAPAQNGFVGVAFWVNDLNVYDSIYFRAFNFRAEDPLNRSHSVQYISMPQWPWERLREEFTGDYEKAIDPAPDGDEWFHARIVIEDGQIRVYVNGADEPSLEVTRLNERRQGSVGLWCSGYGQIANLEISPAE